MRRIFFYTFLFNTILVYAQCVGDDCNYTIQSVASYGNFCLPVSATYSVFFEDNFDGTQLDLSKWNPRYGVIRDPNHITEKQWYTSNNLTVENGVLKIKIKKEVPPIFGHNDLTGQDEMFDYSSGEIDSKLSFGYGRYEIKCKVAVGRGFFPAFWMYGGGDAGLANEMDVFEFNNNNFSNQLTTLHLWDNGTNNTCQMPCGGVNNGFDFSQWHIFTFDWTPTYVRWLVDGVAVRIDAHYTDLNNAPVCDVKPNTPYKVKNIYADPNIPVNIIANVALQMGTYAPDNSTPFPSEMDIDYVRYYKLGCGNELSCYPTSGTPSPIFQNLGGRDTPPYAPVLRITNLNNCSTAYLEIFDIIGRRVWYNPKPINGYNVGISNPVEWEGFGYAYDNNGNIIGLSSMAAGTYTAKLTVANDCGTFVFGDTFIKIDDGRSTSSIAYPNGPKVPNPCCLYDLSIQNQTLNGNSLLYSVGHNISAGPSVSVPTGSNVTFNAGNEIQLLPDFHVTYGGGLNVEIVPCAGFAPKENENTYSATNNRVDNQNTASSITSTSPPVSNVKQYVSVYPNPTNGSITVEIDNELATQNPFFKLYDLSGRLVFESKLNTTPNSLNFMESRIKNGMYYYIISTSNNKNIKYNKLLIAQ